ncbi:MAG: polysaccharide deacetylase family protein, partial [Proteobacteria bacterium]|nr:polysaccharide deacetylase family protein [Pseudomonadota bacterium]
CGTNLKGFEKEVFFTFDDGPSAYGKILKKDVDIYEPIKDPIAREFIKKELPNYDFNKTATENLLDLLKEHNIKAIFFLWGQSIRSNPNANHIIQRMIREGHVIGNHSYSHYYSTKEPFDRVAEDFVKNHKVISELAGSEVKFFRPPYGDWRPNLTKKFLDVPALRHYGFPLLWTNMFHEWALKSTADLENLHDRVKSFREDCKDGKVRAILLHDIYIPGVMLASILIGEAQKLGYKIGDANRLAQNVIKKSQLFHKFPFLYYIKKIPSRLWHKLNQVKPLTTKAL